MDNLKLIDINGLSKYNEKVKGYIQEQIPQKVSVLENDSQYATLTEVDVKVQELITNTELKFFCIEPVVVKINDKEHSYQPNTLVDLFLKKEDIFEIIPSSDNSILALYSWPYALDTFFSWLNGVSVFDGILFDMNSEDMYTKWNQGNQGKYRVQFAQYTNCVFWSDNAYVSDVALRTNYTLYNSSQLPLCYSSIPENTFKSFYCAYGVINDPNWTNVNYKTSFAAATWATQVFSYYGARTIGVFNMDASYFNIPLPKDCRGLMFYSPTIENAGVFDASNTTNFGAKSGSWRDAFAYCYNLKNLYIKNLKASINVSWSPISQDALNFIMSNAINTSSITISLSPYTYYQLSETNKNLAIEKNIKLELLSDNYVDDARWGNKADKTDLENYTTNENFTKFSNEVNTKLDSLVIATDSDIDAITAQV